MASTIAIASSPSKQQQQCLRWSLSLPVLLCSPRSSLKCLPCRRSNNVLLSWPLTRLTVSGRGGRRRLAATVFASSAAASTSSSSSPAPSTQPLVSDIVWPAAGAFVAMAAMSAVDKYVAPMGLSFTIAPFGAVCAVLFSASNTPAAKKYNMFVSHIACAAMGVAALALFGPGWVARSVSLAASLAFMQMTGTLHPPAAGLPLLFIDAPKFQQLQWWYVLFPSAVGCILLCLIQEVVLYLKTSCKF